MSTSKIYSMSYDLFLMNLYAEAEEIILHDRHNKLPRPYYPPRETPDSF